MMVRRRLLTVGSALAVIAALALPVGADHAWGTYHWAKPGSVLNLSVGDNVGSAWDLHLDVAVADWNASTVLNLSEVAGGTSPRRCRPTAGRIEVCNAPYGANGWLGVAQIWTSGSHITQAITKLNDTYFTDAYGYNSPEWRQFVTCQELGHDFGLDHTDETFGNPNDGTCMDYTSDPDGPPSNLHPNAHDYEMLEAIYGHVDSGGGGGGKGQAGQLPPAAEGAGPGDSPQSWGRLVKSNRRGGLFHLDLGRGRHVFTFVIWA